MKAADNGQSLTGSDPIGEEPDIAFRVSLPELDQPLESLEEFYRQKEPFHRTLARASLKGRQVTARGATHVVHAEQPALIIALILVQLE